MSRDWEREFATLSARDAGSLSASELELAGEAAFWTNRFPEANSYREQSVTAYSKDNDVVSAVRVALLVAWGHGVLGSHAVAGGWFAKTARMLEGVDECVAHGELENALAHLEIPQGNLESALQRARKTYAIGERFGDLGLQAAALNTQGAILIRLGEVAEGTALLDESMAMAVTGDLPPFTTAGIYCTTISACQRVGDTRRASEWTDAAEQCVHQTGLQDFPGDCRAHRVSILRLNGRWDDAEAMAASVIGLAGAEPSHVATLHQEVGDIRLRRGAFDEARAALEAAEALGRNPQPERALLALAEGDARAAASLITGALEEQTWDRLARARLLPAAVEIALATGGVATAQNAARELAEIAASFETLVLTASTAVATGRVAAAESDYPAATSALRDGMQRWLELPAPFEAASAQLALAHTLQAAGRTDDAVRECIAACKVFEQLTAKPSIAAGETLLDQLDRAKAARSGAARRVTRTFVFTDIVGSTGLLEAIGDDAWQNLVRWHDQTLRQHFAKNQGEEIDHAGDGFFVAFATPDAALDCAVAIQQALARHQTESGFAPKVRIGVHTAIANQDEEGYNGLGVHHAARIGAEALGGEVLVSLATLDTCDPSRSCDDPRSLTLKGIAEPTSVATLRW